MMPSPPGTNSDRRTIAEERAKAGRETNRPASISADTDHGGSFQNASRRATTRPAGQQIRPAELHTVAKVCILAGQTVGKLIQIRFPGDSGSNRSKPFNDR